MKKRRAILTVWSLLIVLCISNMRVSATTCTNKGNVAYDYVTKILTEYYQAVDQYQEYDFSDDIASITLLQYINQKIEATCYKQEVYGKADKQNYKVDFQLLSSQEIDTNLQLTIVANVEFKYKDASFDSSYKEEIQLILSENEGKYYIKEWYMPYDDYDTNIRGEIKDISNSYGWNNLLRLNNINDKQEELNEKIKMYYDNLKEQIAVESDKILEKSYDKNEVSNQEDSAMLRTTLRSLNKSNMVSWANNNCIATSPVSGNPNRAPYYDFSQIAGNYDCTNFVSHAILAGGSVVYNTGQSSTGWYYQSLNNRSSSWSGVPNLHDFLTSNTTKGPVGRAEAYANIYVPGGEYPYKPGDILQFHNGSVWRHSTLIVGYTSIPGSATLTEAVVTGRTSSTSCNNQVRQSTIYEGQARRVIVLSGYYK